MNKKKYLDYSWVWLVVAETLPSIFGLVLFSTTNNIKFLFLSITISVVLYTVTFGFVVILGRKNSKVKK